MKIVTKSAEVANYWLIAPQTDLELFIAAEMLEKKRKIKVSIPIPRNLIHSKS